MNKDPLAGAVMAAATRVREHHVQRLELASRRASQLAPEAQVTPRQAVGDDIKEIPGAADRTR